MRIATETIKRCIFIHTTHHISPRPTSRLISLCFSFGVHLWNLDFRSFSNISFWRSIDDCTDAEKFCTANLVSCPSNSYRLLSAILSNGCRFWCVSWSWQMTTTWCKVLVLWILHIANALSVGDVEFMYFSLSEFRFSHKPFLLTHPQPGRRLH